MERPTLNRSRNRLVLDYGLFVGFVLAMAPHLTGGPVHEWLGLLLGAAVIAHLLLQWDWIVRVSGRIAGRLSTRPRINWVIDALLFVCTTLVMLSGLMISESIAGLIGWEHAKNDVMHTLHSLSAQWFVYLMAAHIALHWSWVARTAKRVLSPRDATSINAKQLEV